MKRNSLFKGIVLSTALSAILTGCGSIESLVEDIKDDIVPEIAQSSIRGKAIDGYLKDAVVCLDLNQDGYCQASSEPLTTTLDDGSFTLAVSEAHRSHENFDEALLLVFGGVDVDTGKDFRGKLYAPNDGSELLNVSPITTLVAKNLEKALKAERKLTREQIREKIKLARKKVADALEIDEDEVGLDPVTFQKENQDDKLIRKALQVQKPIEALMFAADIDESERKDKIEEIYEALADGLDDLDGEKGLDKLFRKAAEKDKFKNMFQNHDHDSMLALTDAITRNIDSAFDGFEQDEDQLEKIAAITEDAFAQIEEDVQNQQDDFITGFVFLEDNDDRFKNDFDWLKKYIELDLKEIGIEPTPDLVNRLKAVYQNDVRAGVLLSKADELKKDANQDLLELYKRILEFKKQSELNKNQEDAEHDDVATLDLKSLIAGKIFYEVEMIRPERFTFGVTYQVTYEITKIEINEDATTAIINDDEESQLTIKDNSIIVTDGDEKFVLIYKGEEDKYIELYRHGRETLKLFKDFNDAENYILEEQGEDD